MIVECTSGPTQSPCWPARRNTHHLAEQIPRTNIAQCSCSNMPPAGWDNKQRQRPDSHLEVDLYSVFNSLLQHKRVLLEAVQVSWEGWKKKKKNQQSQGKSQWHWPPEGAQLQVSQLSCSIAVMCDHQGRAGMPPGNGSLTHLNRNDVIIN